MTESELDQIRFDNRSDRYGASKTQVDELLAAYEELQRKAERDLRLVQCDLSIATKKLTEISVNAAEIAGCADEGYVNSLELIHAELVELRKDRTRLEAWFADCSFTGRDDLMLTESTPGWWYVSRGPIEEYGPYSTAREALDAAMGTTR